MQSKPPKDICEKVILEQSVLEHDCNVLRRKLLDIYPPEVHDDKSIEASGIICIVYV